LPFIHCIHEANFFNIFSFSCIFLHLFSPSQFHLWHVHVPHVVGTLSSTASIHLSNSISQDRQIHLARSYQHPRASAHNFQQSSIYFSSSTSVRCHYSFRQVDLMGHVRQLTYLHCYNGFKQARAGQDGLEVCTITSEASSLGWNLSQATNCHPGVSHVGRGINVCVVPRMYVKLDVPSVSIS